MFVEKIIARFLAKSSCDENTRQSILGFGKALHSLAMAAEDFDDAQDNERPSSHAVNDGLDKIAETLIYIKQTVQPDLLPTALETLAKIIQTGVAGQKLSFAPYPLTTKSWLMEVDLKCASLPSLTMGFAAKAAKVALEQQRCFEQIGLLVGRIGQLHDDGTELALPLKLHDHVFALAYLAETNPQIHSLLKQPTETDLEQLRQMALKPEVQDVATSALQRWETQLQEQMRLILDDSDVKELMSQLRTNF